MQKFATTLRLTIALLALGASMAFAQVLVPESLEHGQDVEISMFGEQGRTPHSVNVAGIVYDNTASPAVGAFSSTSLASVWGDELLMISGGILSQHKLAIYNSSSSLGALLTANIQVSFYDGATATFIGSYTSSINFGTGLAKGSYSILTITGIDALNYNLPADVIVLQTITSKTGMANRLGFVSLDPPTVGSSDIDFYANSTTVGAAGWYTLSGINTNLAHQITVLSPPVPTKTSSWGRIKSLYR